MSSMPPPPLFSPSRPGSAGTASGVGGLISGGKGGGVSMDQVQALLTATIQQMGGTLADGLKMQKQGKMTVTLPRVSRSKCKG